MAPRATLSRLAATALAALGLLALGAAPALASRPSGGGGGGGHGGGGEEGSSSATGLDVSYPQCGKSLPSGHGFAIVGLDGGLANDLSPCFGPSEAYPGYAESELYWALASTTGTGKQPKASLYVNTADPGDIYEEKPVADWPTSGATPDGECATSTVSTGKGTYTVGEDSTACAFEYGRQRAAQDLRWLQEAAGAIDAQSPPLSAGAQPSEYPWWLDVETANTWQTGSAGVTMNLADIEGMASALREAGASTVGVYSTEAQWDSIAGGPPSAGALAGLPDWIPGAKTQSGAESNCKLPAFTGGAVVLTQWVSHHSLDEDYAC
jgi:hypothetical protein